MKKLFLALCLTSFTLSAPVATAGTTDDLKENAIEAYEKAKEKTKDGVEYLDEATKPLQEKSKKVWNNLKNKWEAYKDKDENTEETLKDAGVF